MLILSYEPLDLKKRHILHRAVPPLLNSAGNLWLLPALTLGPHWLDDSSSCPASSLITNRPGSSWHAGSIDLLPGRPPRRSSSHKPLGSEIQISSVS